MRLGNRGSKALYIRTGVLRYLCRSSLDWAYVADILEEEWGWTEYRSAPPVLVADLGNPDYHRFYQQVSHALAFLEQRDLVTSQRNAGQRRKLWAVTQSGRDAYLTLMAEFEHEARQELADLPTTG